MEQKKPYGLIMNGTDGGLTIPEESYFNLFPSQIFRLYTNGKMQRVRGVRTVGTPNQMLENIIKTGKNYQTFNGRCESESGAIPSTETAPEALINSVEIESMPKSEYVKVRNLIIKTD